MLLFIPFLNCKSNNFLKVDYKELYNNPTFYNNKNIEITCLFLYIFEGNTIIPQEEYIDILNVNDYSANLFLKSIVDEKYQYFCWYSVKNKYKFKYNNIYLLNIRGKFLYQESGHFGVFKSELISHKEKILRCYNQ